MEKVTVRSAVMRGVEAAPVRIEVAIETGALPSLSFVGYNYLRSVEAKSRIRCAIRSAGYEVPRAKVTVRFEPFDPVRSPLEKTSVGIDLAVAAGILAASAQIPRKWLENAMVVGDIDLDGRASAVRGLPSIQSLAASEGLTLAAPLTNRAYGAFGPVLGIDTLSNLRGAPDSLRPLDAMGVFGGPVPDFSEISGNEELKRAMSISAAGRHGIVVSMTDDPQLTPSDLARALASLRGEPTERELYRAAVAATLDRETPVEVAFISPRRAVVVGPDTTSAALVGGGRPVSPGALTLASGGVVAIRDAHLFQDTAALMMRQPIHDGEARLVRVDGPYRLPTDVIPMAIVPRDLILGDDGRARRVEEAVSRRFGYLPIRADVEPEHGRFVRTQSTSDLMAEVERARAFSSLNPERELPGDDDPSYMQVARTIADMEESAPILKRHIEEASRLAGMLRARIKAARPANEAMSPSTADIKSALESRNLARDPGAPRKISR